MCYLEGRWRVGAKDFNAGQRARRSVRGMLEALQFERRELEDAEIVVGELVTNALRYTAGPVALAVAHCDEHLEVEVVDEGHCFDPTVISTPGDEGGRGILIVEAIAAELHIEPRAAGCAVVAILASSCAPRR
jgi:anti-sigma regulatory factor (Ser/Thr protein kinase)